MKKDVLVDVDGVLAQYDGWKGVEHIGEPIFGAVEFTHLLGKQFNVVIFTTRCCADINKPEVPELLANRVRGWLDRHGFHYDHIWTGQGKPIGVAIIDDRAIRCEPQTNPDAFADALASLAGL